GHVVLDTNVRRVLARAISGVEFPANSVNRAERDLAAELLPEDEATAATWSVAVMELGALVCTAKAPRCHSCPIKDRCAWVAQGKPAHAGPPRRVQGFAGTDRQVRGRLLSVVREAEHAVAKPRLDVVWDEPVQRERALASLLADGLLVQVVATGPDGDHPHYALP
ncbi:MAG TPA: A/G-specific adenine glycosylase, partial [Nocardioides sp.]